jgi:hypothetical protein
LDVLNGIKSFLFAFIFNFGKRKWEPEPTQWMGKGIDQTPLFMEELFELLTRLGCYVT